MFKSVQISLKLKLVIYQAHGSLGQQVTRKEEGKKPKESSLKESLGSLKRYMVCFVEGALADAKKKWWQPLLGIYFPICSQCCSPCVPNSTSLYPISSAKVAPPFSQHIGEPAAWRKFSR
jgi:hypothetical protein